MSRTKDCTENFLVSIFKLVVYNQLENMNMQKLTVSPRFSPLSAETLSATAIADILRGCVQMMLQNAPRPDSISDSRTY